MLLSWITEIFVNNINLTEDQMLQAESRELKLVFKEKIKKRKKLF